MLDTVKVTATPPRPVNDHEVFQAERAASRDSLLRELSAARSRWTQHSRSRVRYRWDDHNYSVMSVTASSDLLVEAIGDSVVSMRNERSIPTLYADPSHDKPTAAFLFRLAEAAIRGEADRIVVTFDAVLGMPTRVFVDRRVGTSDDEDDIVVKDIQVIRD